MNLDAQIASLVDLGELALRFGRVERITFHPDCKTRESDTTHTVMLVWAACSLAQLTEPQLDLGLIAQFASVHDAPEALCGDTQTLKISPEERAAKQEREGVARRDIDALLLGRLPWLPEVLEEYEAQALPEARFVRAVDKCLPTLTHILNAGHALQVQQITREELTATMREQLAAVAQYAGEFASLVNLLAALQVRILKLI